MATCRDCNNPVRAGQVLCWRHGGDRADESAGERRPTPVEAAARRELQLAMQTDPTWIALRRPASISLDTGDYSPMAHGWERALGVPPERTQHIVDAVREVTGSTTLATPAKALEQRGRVRDVALQLRERLPGSTVEVFRFQGLTRYTTSLARPQLRAPEAQHEVIVIDRQGEQPLLVDPCVAALAPVPRDRQHLPLIQTGMPNAGWSPYADELWVGHPEDYRDNAFLTWESAQRVAL